MSFVSWIIIFWTAFFAGAINAIAGGGTLLTFPVLLWLGLDAKVANATSTVALWPGLFGGLYGYRKELENSSTILFRLGLTGVIQSRRRMALDRRTVADVRSDGAFPDSLRNSSLHVPGSY